jgi:uncharacterized membrane protein
MPAVVYGIVAAVALGCSDFAASRAGRTESFFSVVRTNMAATALLCPFLLMVRPSSWTASAVVFGALSGVAMSSGLVVLYRGYGTGKIGIVAPVSSVVLSVVPVCFGFARGEQVGGVAIVGMAIGCAAVGLSSWQGTEGGGRGTMTSVLLGAVAGVLFGVAFSMMAAPGDDVGLVRSVRSSVRRCSCRRHEPGACWLWSQYAQARRWRRCRSACSSAMSGRCQWPPHSSPR